MHSTLPKVTVLTIIVSTAIILIFTIAIIYFFFLYQKRRYRHQQEMITLQKFFKETLLQSKIEIQEQTLDHIGKELHANIGHLASLINMRLSIFLEKIPDKLQVDILETKKLSKLLMSELKALSLGLNNDYVNKVGFCRALTEEVERIGRLERFNASLTVTGDPWELQEDRQVILFRLCQEALNNVVRYARASIVVASVSYAHDSMTIEIKDDGIGFDVASIMQRGAENNSTGLLNMHKRAETIGADFKIISKMKEGTLIVIKIPIK